MTEPTAKFSFVRAVDFAIRESLRHSIKTMIPGVVHAYDPATKRGRIQPSVKIDVEGGTNVPRAMLIDVPVLTQATGGIMVHQKVDRGDPVILLFSERGIEDFKEKIARVTDTSDPEWAISEPTPGHFFNVMDAVALRGGIETIPPVDDDAFVIQSKSGNTYIKLKEGEIEMRCGSRVFRMTPDAGRLS